jgi:hypothetical protein
MRELRGVFAAVGAGASESLERLVDPFLKISLRIRIALVFAALILMNAKPQLQASLGIVGAFAVLGLAAALLTPNRKSPSFNANSDARI